MENMNIVFSINNNYVPYCLTTICSICENNKSEQIDFFILNTNISEENKAIMNSYISKYSNCTLSFIILKNSIYNTFPINQANQTNKYISIETYFRLFLTELLPPSINKLLYLDSDLIIRGTLHDLYEKNISSVALAAVKDNEYYNIQEYNRLRYEPNFGYFNAGVLLINLEYWRNNNCYEKFTSFISSHPERLQKHDQDVLNSVFYNCKKWLPLKFNLTVGFMCKEKPLFYTEWEEIENARKNPTIIHYSDKIKPWYDECLHPYKNEYLKYQALTPFFNLPKIKTTLTKKQKIRHILSKLHLCKDIEKREDFYDHTLYL